MNSIPTSEMIAFQDLDGSFKKVNKQKNPWHIYFYGYKIFSPNINKPNTTS